MPLEVREIGTNREWNRFILGCSNFNVYSSFEWGDYKRNNWNVSRLVFLRSNQILAGVQVLSKKILGITFAWAPGGILTNNFHDVPAVIDSLTSVLGPRLFVLRLTFLDETTGENESVLKTIQNLTGARHSTRRHINVVVDLERQGEVLEGMSANHRRNYRKALRRGLTFKGGEVIVREYARLSRALSDLKRRPGIAIPSEAVERVARSFGSHMRMYSARAGEEIVAACLVMRFDDHAYYYVAASSDRGRSLQASYFMVKMLMENLKSDGTRVLDLGGIAPGVPGLQGVNYFKQGFSGREVRSLGDYDLANSRWPRYLLNLAVSRKFTW